MSIYEQRLAKFGRRVLEILHQDKDWNAGTMDDIAAVAYDLNLADCEPDGCFEALQAPGGEKPLFLYDQGAEHPRTT
jgi:hypothetical protein